MAGIREQKKKKTRDAIKASAIQLFEKQGYNQTTIEDIAREAGIGKATIYGYFSTKEEVFRDFCQEETNRIFETVEKQGGDDRPLLDVITDIFMMEYQLVSRNSELTCQLLRESVFPLQNDSDQTREYEQRYFEKLEAFLNEAVSSNQIREDVNLYMLLVHFRFVFIGVVSAWLKGYTKTGEEVRNFMRTQFQLVIEGIS